MRLFVRPSTFSYLWIVGLYPTFLTLAFLPGLCSRVAFKRFPKVNLLSVPLSDIELLLVTQPNLPVFILTIHFFIFCKIIRFAPAMVNQAHRIRPSGDMETQFSTCWQSCTPLPTVQKTFVKCSWSVFTTTALTWKATPMETATLRSAVLFFKHCVRTWPNALLSTELLEVVRNGIALRKCYDEASDMLSCQMVTPASRSLSCMR